MRRAPWKGEKLARCIQRTAEYRAGNPKAAGAKRRELLYCEILGRPLAVIVECGFMSNPEEDVLLGKKFYQIKIVKAIMEGMEDYLAEAKTNA